MSNSEKSIRIPEKEYTNRAERIRVFVVLKGSGKPAPGLPVKIVAELVNSQTEEIREVPIAFLESDRYGYLSSNIGPLARDPQLRHVWLRPNDDLELQVDAFPVMDTRTDPAIVTIQLPKEIIPTHYKGPILPSIPDPDPTDWTISPGSFATNEPLKLGEGGCEELLHSRQADRTFRFVQLIREDEAPETLIGADMADCENQVELLAKRCYRRGVMLEYEITWKPLGHGLGRILYSLPLAPCESIDIAIIDWQRQDETVRTEDTSVAEQLRHIQRRERDIEEAVRASLSETQFGGSFMAGAAGAAAGSWKLIDFGVTSAIGGAMAGSQGKRKLAANTTQRVSDSISQATSVMRRLDSTVVVQASQAEQEVIQTRTVTNHNHCHALTMLYYQVLRHYLVTVRLVDKRDVIFVKYLYVNDIHDPLSDHSLFDYFTEATVFHYHRILRESLLDPALECGFGAIAKALCNAANIARKPVDIPISDYLLERIDARFVTGASTDDQLIIIELYLITRDGREVVLLHEGDYRWAGGHISDRKKIGGWLYLDGGTRTESRLFSPGQEDIINLYPEVPVRWDNVDAIKIVNTSSYSLRLSGVYFRTCHEDNLWSMIECDDSLEFTDAPPENIRVTPFGPVGPSDFLTNTEFCCKQGLLEHLNHNKLYYSRAIWLAQDPEERTRAFEYYRLEIPNPTGGRIEGRLTDLIENRIAGVSGDYVAFPLTVTSLANEFVLNNEIERRLIKKEQIISLPTRGVFAEAKLSHCNSCEERDVTRYWDWTESPCPEPPEIAPVEAGEHEVTTPPEGTPSTMPLPVVNIVNPPNIPDPTGLAAALGVLRTPDIFRDMSAVNELSDLLQELAEGAVSLVQARQRARGILERSERKSGKQGGSGDTPSEAHDRWTVAQRAIKQGQESGALTEEEARNLERGSIEEIVMPEEVITSGSGGEDDDTGGRSGTVDCTAIAICQPQRLADESTSPWAPVYPGTRINLDATRSTCPRSRVASLEWFMRLKPLGSGAAISSTSSETTHYVADVPGDYEVYLTLVTDDGRVHRDSCTVHVSAETVTPVENPSEVIEDWLTRAREDSSLSSRARRILDRYPNITPAFLTSRNVREISEDGAATLVYVQRRASAHPPNDELHDMLVTSHDYETFLQNVRRFTESVGAAIETINACGRTSASALDDVADMIWDEWYLPLLDDRNSIYALFLGRAD
jgi:hypothetical protein